MIMWLVVAAVTLLAAIGLGSLQTLQCTSQLGDWGSAFTRTTL